MNIYKYQLLHFDLVFDKFLISTRVLLLNGH
jgi:hypothetical protein